MQFLYKFMNFGKFVMVFASRNLTDDKRPRWLREKGKSDAKKNMCDFSLVIKVLMQPWFLEEQYEGPTIATMS